MSDAGSTGAGAPGSMGSGSTTTSGNIGGNEGANKDNPFSHPLPEGHAKTLSSVLGEVTWLMSQSPLHKRFFIEDLEWFVMTPALLQQFRLYYAQDRPIGVVLWATVNAEVEQMLLGGTTKLRPQDWQSGNQAWIVEVIAPFGGVEEMVKDLKTKVFPERELRYLQVVDGQRTMKVA
ncbi:MAG: toxin-activating lysine-acyltransferase [Filomicrobium sp.]